MTSLVAVAVSRDDGRLELRAPAVGSFRDAPAIGTAVPERGTIGSLEILGRSTPVVAPAAGVVVEVGSAQNLTRRPVGYGELLVVLGEVAEIVAVAAGALTDPDLVFRSPSSGRFYGRPSPDKAPFVVIGDELSDGQTICLLEVMKTFNRITYGGDGLPRRVRVAAIGPADGDDLSPGDVILELDPA